jgi:cytochrome P450
MTDLTAKFLERWRTCAAEQEQRDVDADFLDLSQLLAGHYLMGPGFERVADRFCRAAIEVKQQWPLPPRSVTKLLRRRGDGWTDELAAAVRDIDACVYEYLAAERKNDFAGAGLVKMLVDGSRAQGAEFDDRALRDQILTVFFAGHETTATSLSWIHYLLDKNRDARSKLRAEVDSVLGGRMPTSAELDRLVYTEQVINEALRLYSPIHSLSRVALEDDTLGGYHIPAGATVYVSLYATHRLPSLWPDPDRFDPERFTADAIARRPRFAFIPFAAGHRNCIGGSAAMAELKLAVALIAQRYELTLAPGQRVEGAAGTTMHPRYGMKMLIRAI